MDAKSFKIISSKSLKQLHKRIKAHEHSGWQSDGAVTLTKIKSRPGEHHYQQCLKKIP